ncbi:CST complex subunit TEN1-like [Silene latifolia]|uniref:CST complex subunit TEN1-like n=1 Tax=Silene latifolia TaxID=37657 RepID=UPI003D7732DB
MAAPVVNSGALIILEELKPSSPHYQDGASLRVTGKLEEYNVETAVAVISDGSATLKIDTQYVELQYRLGSIYQFIGELLLESGIEPILKARVGRNVDGIDLNLYRQTLNLLKEFQAEQA